MSYVLDALRRADAERQQGRPPDLHTPGLQGADAAPAFGHRAGQGRRARPIRLALIALALLLGLAALATLGGWLASAQAPATHRPDAGAPPAGAARPAPLPAQREVPAEPARPAPVPPRPAPEAPEALPAAPAPVARPASAAPIPLERLDPALRQALPPLQFSGAMDSPDPAARMLIVNGRLLREGDAIAADLVLERIALRSALLRWRDRRIEVRY